MPAPIACLAPYRSKHASVRRRRPGDASAASPQLATAVSDPTAVLKRPWLSRSSLPSSSGACTPGLAGSSNNRCPGGVPAPMASQACRVAISHAHCATAHSGRDLAGVLRLP